ncbi:MAG: hypothetical protein R2707_12040 [Acidimicrobiales bacterium]
MVGVLLDEIGECLLVDLSDIGRDVVEGGIAPKLFAWRRPTALVGERFLGIIALEGEWRSRIAP